MPCPPLPHSYKYFRLTPSTVSNGDLLSYNTYSSVPVLQGLKAELRCQINRTQGQIWAIIYFWTHAYCIGTLVFIPAFLDKCFFLYVFVLSLKYPCC